MKTLGTIINLSLIASLIFASPLKAGEIKKIKFGFQCSATYSTDKNNNSLKIYEAACGGRFMLDNPDGDDRVDSVCSKISCLSYKRKFCSEEEKKLNELYFEVYNEKIQPKGEIYEAISEYEFETKLKSLMDKED